MVRRNNRKQTLLSAWQQLEVCNLHLHKQVVAEYKPKKKRNYVSKDNSHWDNIQLAMKNSGVNIEAQALSLMSLIADELESMPAQELAQDAPWYEKLFRGLRDGVQTMATLVRDNPELIDAAKRILAGL
jgi:hypothetical protein